MRISKLILLIPIVAGLKGQTTVLTNFDSYGVDDEIQVSVRGGTPIGTYQSQMFTVGSSNASFKSLTINMESNAGGLSGTPNFTVALYSSTYSSSYGEYLPGTLVETLSGSSNPSIAGSYTYTASMPVTLSANSEYYWVASDPGATGTYHLSTTSAGAGTSDSGWTIGDFNQRTNSGNVTQEGGEGGINAVFSVQTVDSGGLSAVPEPSTYALIAGVAVLGFAAFLRRPDKQSA